MERYRAWVSRHVEGDGYGHCTTVVPAMIEAFPELTMRRGFFHDAFWGRRQHMWAVAPDGTIVDPTGLQHPTGSLFALPGSFEASLYEAIPDDELEARIPSGVCLQCGDDVYGGATFCGTNCAKTTARRFNDSTTQ